MTGVKPKAAKPRKRAEPSVRLATRFVILCYQHFDLAERRPIELSYTGYALSFKEHIKNGDLAEQLPFWIWNVLSSRGNKKFCYSSRKQDPLWCLAQAQAERFIEENRELIAEEELST